MEIRDRLSEIEVPDSLDIKTACAIEDALSERIRRQRARSRGIKISGFFLAVFLSIAMIQPVWAEDIPFFGKVFSYLNDVTGYAGDYDKYATEIGTTAENGGIKITMSEVYCDGENLFISYVIKSEKPFRNYVPVEYFKKQMMFDSTVTIYDKNEKRILNKVGEPEILDGKFVDEHTFLGVASYVKEEKFPEQFDVEVACFSLGLISEEYEGEGKNDYPISGIWGLTAAVKVNYEDIKVITPNVSNRGHSIDKVIVSPLMVTIETSYPDIYMQRETIDYFVYCFTNDEERLPLGSSGIGDKTKAFDKISRSYIKDELRIYVVDEAVMRSEGADSSSEEDCQKYAVVQTKIPFEEETR